jgi:acyl-CoA synthetase (AMP-forming)/AMP-acid ligase II
VSDAPLLGWLDRPAAHRGLHCAGPGSDWTFVPYQELAALVRRAAAGLVALGVPAGGVVGVVQRTGARCAATLFGALAAGCTASPVPPPTRLQDPRSHLAHVDEALRVARPALVVADADLVFRLRPVARRYGCPVVDVATLFDAAGNPPADGARRPAGHLALRQFTSGSSGPVRAVDVPRAALSAHVGAIRDWLGLSEADTTATWLPPWHDMGLVGCLLTPVAHQADLWLMPPEEFIGRPLRFLRCFGASGATVTALPGFALAHVVRRVRREDLSGLDFAGWRSVVVGAERLDASALAAFAALLRPNGFDPRALRPAYGLAEATLAVTGLPVGEAWRVVAVDPATLRPGRRVVPGTVEVVGCGRPLGTTWVSIEDESGESLAPGVVGEIVVRGGAVAAGYVGDADGSSTRLAGGTLRTGDAGFVLDGHVYVVGRLGDGIKLRGRMLFAETVEAALAAAGLPPRRTVVLLGHRGDRATAVVVHERAEPGWVSVVRPLLRRLTDGARIVLVDAPAGAIARTTSGKPRRRVLWQHFLDGRLPGTVVYTTAGIVTTAGGSR